MIKIYRFQDAPKSLQQLSRHGGDEDWVIVGGKKEIDDSPFGLAQVGDDERGYLRGWGWAQWTRRRNEVIIIFAHA